MCVCVSSENLVKTVDGASEHNSFQEVLLLGLHENVLRVRSVLFEVWRKAKEMFSVN